MQILISFSVLFVCGLAQNDDCDKPQIDPTDGSQYGFCAEKKPFILTRTHALTHQQAIADALRLEQNLGEEPTATKEEATSEVPALVLPSAEVSYCSEKCSRIKPLSVNINGDWFNVLQFEDGFKDQWVTVCKCPELYCTGQSSSSSTSISWKGRCVRERAWVRLFVYNENSCAYRWVKVDRGCCCVPYKYANQY